MTSSPFLEIPWSESRAVRWKFLPFLPFRFPLVTDFWWISLGRVSNMLDLVSKQGGFATGFVYPKSPFLAFWSFLNQRFLWQTLDALNSISSSYLSFWSQSHINAKTLPSFRPCIIWLSSRSILYQPSARALLQSLSIYLINGSLRFFIWPDST